MIKAKKSGRGGERVYEGKEWYVFYEGCAWGLGELWEGGEKEYCGERRLGTARSAAEWAYGVFGLGEPCFPGMALHPVEDV